MSLPGLLITRVFDSVVISQENLNLAPHLSNLKECGLGAELELDFFRGFDLHRPHTPAARSMSALDACRGERIWLVL